MVRAKRNEEERLQIPSNCNGKVTGIIPHFYCENTAIPITGDLEMLGVAVDDKMKFDRHIANACRKVSQQIPVLKRRKKILPFETRKCLYTLDSSFRTLTTVRRLGISVEKVNDRALRFVVSEKQTSYCELLDKLGLPSLANQRLGKK